MRTVADLIALLQTLPQTADILFSDDNGTTLWLADTSPEVDQEFDLVTLHVTEVGP